MKQLSLPILFSVSMLCAQDETPPIEAANTALRAEDYGRALSILAPLIDNPADPSAAEARGLAGAAYHQRAEDHFRNARILQSISDFDRFVDLLPEDEPGLWQRGIAYYYAAEYAAGASQFESHREVNPEDVENAVWHFLCLARGPDGSVERARANLIPVRNDWRVPMKEIHGLFAGTGSVEAVVDAASRGNETAKFYADLYIGLYHEAMGETEKSLAFIARAASYPSAKHFMADVARVHLILRDRESSR